MSAHSLSLVFSPNLIREPNHAPLASDSLKKFSVIVEFMIDNGCSIFEVEWGVMWVCPVENGAPYLRMYSGTSL